MTNIITVKDLCLWYSEHQALKNININIPENNITALIGPSGCGKSTFLKTLNRMNDLVPGVRNHRGSKVSGSGHIFKIRRCKYAEKRSGYGFPEA